MEGLVHGRLLEEVLLRRGARCSGLLGDHGAVLVVEEDALLGDGVHRGSKSGKANEGGQDDVNAVHLDQLGDGVGLIHTEIVNALVPTGSAAAMPSD